METAGYLWVVLVVSVALSAALELVVVQWVAEVWEWASVSGGGELARVLGCEWELA